MLRFAPITALLALAACATPAAVSGDNRLSGQDIQAAVGLYGPWDQRVVLGDQPIYIWRRHLRPAGAASDVYCELRIETAYRTTVSRSQMQGYPAACDLFSVRYKSALR
jgi:hypothetical protein